MNVSLYNILSLVYNECIMSRVHNIYQTLHVNPSLGSSISQYLKRILAFFIKVMNEYD